MATATIKKTGAKINFYKFVGVVDPKTTGGLGKKPDPTTIGLHTAINKNILATNNLGEVVNSIAKILQQFAGSQALLLENLKLSAPKFEAIYAKPTGAPDMGKLEEGDLPKTEMPGFLESIFNLFKDLLTLAVGIPIFKWLSDPANTEKIQKTVETLIKFFTFVKDFISDRFVGLVDNLYELFRDDKTWFEKLPNIFGALVNFAGLFLAIRWLSNPMKLVKDFGSVLGFFNKNLLASKGKLSKRLKGLGAAAAIGVAAVAVTKAVSAANKPDDGESDTPEASKGGVIPKLAAGGFINGPMSGYPVSLDGGKSTAFIGHGLEYVAQRQTGGGVGGFVVPLDTPATRKDPNLTERRITESRSQGFDLSKLFAYTDKTRSSNKTGSKTDSKAPSSGDKTLTPMQQWAKKYPKLAEKVKPGQSGYEEIQDLINPNRFADAAKTGFSLDTSLFSKESEHKFKFGKDPFAEMAAGGKISLTSNGGGNKRLEPGKTYTWRELNPHHSGEGTNRVYNGINVGHPKDYGVGKLPQFMPSGPNGNIPTPVSGKVLESGKIAGSGYGKSVVLQTNLGNMHFAHLSKIGEGVKKGSTVPAGKIVGVQGGDGDSGPNSYAEHLHLNASKKGHEAFVNFVTSGKATTGRGGDSGSGGTAVALAPGKAAHQRVGGDKAFLKRVNEVARKIKANPADLLGMMASESGLNPAADNGTHVGLIQFSASSAASVGTTQAALKKMSRAEQMDYVEKYLYPKLKDVKGPVTAGHLYTAVFLPAFAGKPANFVVASKDGSQPAGYSSESPRWYKSNSGLDSDGDGKITIGDLSKRVEKKKQEFGISGGGVDGDGGDVDMEFDGDVQSPEPAIPEDPLAAFTMLGEQLGKIFGSEKAPEESTAATSSTEGGAKPPASGPGSAASRPGGASGKSGSPASPTGGPSPASPATSGSAAQVSAVDSSRQSVPGGPSPAGAAAMQPSGRPSSASQLVSQTTQTLQSREVVQTQQVAAIQQVQQVAAAQSVRVNQMSQAAQKQVAAAQSNVNNQKPVVMPAGGSSKLDLIASLNSSNNPLSRQR